MQIEVDEQTAKQASRFFVGKGLSADDIKRMLELAERCVYLEWRLGILPDHQPDWKDRLDEIAQKAGLPERSHEHKLYLASLEQEPR